jgi:hypothetical protein
MMDAALPPRAAGLRPATLLRLALLADAGASGTLGAVMLAGGAWLAPPLGLPVALLHGAGLVCVLWAALLGWLGQRPTIPAGVVWAVIGLNLVWVADSMLLLASGWVQPAGLGTAFIGAQALAVLGLAAAQWTGLRRSAP